MIDHVVADRYAIAQEIGSGGMGNVYRAIDRRTNIPVAIKVLKSEIANSEMVIRFKREGEALRQLNHPNIVALLDAVQEDNQHYLVMELVEGGALDEILRQSSHLPVKQILNIALDLSDALTRAHRLNIIHRDIKPANVLLAGDGMPRLTDFGIAYTTNSNITEAGVVMGTLAYMSPEVLQGERADARSDIWSLGIMLFEMLAGAHPFKTDHPGALVHAVLTHPLPDVEETRPDAPPAFIDLIHRMVMKDPAERIPSMRLVGVELEALLAGESFATTTGISRSSQSPQETKRFATPSPVSQRVTRNNLPPQTTPFVGRESELVELETLIRDPSIRLLTILASGGMGKTRLSLELAGKFLHLTSHDALFENGLYFVDLAPLTSADNIVQTIGEAVGYVFQQGNRDAKQQLLDYLREKNMLLIMDNFEHVTAGRFLMQDILQVAPQIKILVTSREKLSLSAEAVFVLGGMDFPDWKTPEDAMSYGAVKLFMQSARRARTDFQLAASDLPHVARVCRMVQGTPLGILLAAAWLEALTPREIAEEINSSLDFLETDMHDLPERQRSLRAVFEYSWNLLSAEERILFAQFSIFRGGFTREAAQQITGASLRSLTVMINKSLLRRDNVSGRYEIHELLRQYAQEKLKEVADTISVHEAHSQYYLDLMAQLVPKLKGSGQLDALNRIETDFENLRAAWTCALEQKNASNVQKAIEGLYLFLTFRNRFMDGALLFRAARQVWPAQDQQASLLAGQVLVRYPDQASRLTYELGLTIAQHHNDPFEIAFCRRVLGHWISHTEFNQNEGIPMLEASLRDFEALGETFYIAHVLDDIGWSYQLIRDRVRQQEKVTQSLSLRRTLDDKIGMANSLRNMGGAYGGYFDLTGQAIRYWEEAKGIAYEMNDRLGVAWNTSLMAANYIFIGDFERAVTLLDEGYPHAADINDPVVKGYFLVLRGLIYALKDEDYGRARSLVEEGYPPYSKADFRITVTPFTMAVIGCGTGNYEPLRPYMPVFLTTPPFNSKAFYVALLLPCHIVRLAKDGQHERATELVRAFLSSSLTYAGTPFPVQWANRWGVFVRLQQQLQLSLGEEAFQAAWERGAQVTFEAMADEVQIFIDANTTP
jgi:serine/threonine protein kinase